MWCLKTPLKVKTVTWLAEFFLKNTSMEKHGMDKVTLDVADCCAFAAPCTYLKIIKIINQKPKHQP